MARAEVLCGFNAVRFDIPFIMHYLAVPAATCSEWVAKLYDPFEESKLLFDTTLSLNKLLTRHGLDTKSGTGKDAVRMAENAQWADLEFYCKKDTQLTHAVATRLLAAKSQ
jgi:hypothetical protein